MSACVGVGQTVGNAWPSGGGHEPSGNVATAEGDAAVDSSPELPPPPSPPGMSSSSISASSSLSVGGVRLAWVTTFVRPPPSCCCVCCCCCCEGIPPLLPSDLCGDDGADLESACWLSTAVRSPSSGPNSPPECSSVHDAACGNCPFAPPRPDATRRASLCRVCIILISVNEKAWRIGPSSRSCSIGRDDHADCSNVRSEPRASSCGSSKA